MGITKPMLSGKLSREGQVAAGDAIRAFEQSPAWARFVQELEKHKQYQYKLLHTADMQEHLKLAKAGGILQAIDEVYAIMDRILEEAAQARESR